MQGVRGRQKGLSAKKGFLCAFPLSPFTVSTSSQFALGKLLVTPTPNPILLPTRTLAKIPGVAV